MMSRGTGVTLPAYCYTNEIERITAAAMLPPSVAGSDEAFSAAWSIQKTYSQTCAGALRDIGSVIGSASTARDMMKIVDSLGEDGLLRYWGQYSDHHPTHMMIDILLGQSYGTYLGSVAAAMFPDRIHAMVLDGQVNNHDYNAAWYVFFVLHHWSSINLLTHQQGI
jgi:hypothetical protein